MATLFEKSERKFDILDSQMIKFMSNNGLPILRVSLGVVFFWFGILKFFPGLSPAEQLVRDSVSFIFNPDLFYLCLLDGRS